jgi:hypothetical protein
MKKEDKVFPAQVMKEKGRSRGIAPLSHKLVRFIKFS